MEQILNPPEPCEGSDYGAKATGAGADFFAPFDGVNVPANSSLLLVTVTLDVSGGNAGTGCLQGGAEGAVNEYSSACDGSAQPMVIMPASTAPLPVDLITFEAKPLLGGDTDVDWKVASESNVSHYEIERYEDGGNWVVVGKVNARNSSERDYETYEFIDKNVFDGRVATKTYYYRLNIFDRDGSSEYSPMEIVKFYNGNNGPVNITVYPNPSTDRLAVEFASDGSAAPASDLVIYNTLGQMMHSQVIPEGADAVYLEHEDIGLVSGTYMLHILDNESNTLAQEKIIVQR